MIYALKITWRYLSSSLGQTALLISGVAVGVFVFVFISALIGGLGVFLVQRTVGDIAHITLSAPPSEAGLLRPTPGALLAVQRETGRRDLLRGADGFLPHLEAMSAIKAVSPQITGNGFILRGQSRAAVAVTGVEPALISVIANFDDNLVAGSSRLGASEILIGATLAEDLGVTVGQVIRLKSDRDIERSLQIAGIYKLGVDSVDKRAAYVSLGAARSLFDLPEGLSRIEVKLHDLYQADSLAPDLAALTGYKALPWTEGNAQLLQGLNAQSQSSDMIKAFAMISIIIGVASALLLSSVRRSPEIGIMRAFGAKKGFVLSVFMLQGALIGLLGGIIGAGLGFTIMVQIPPPGPEVQTSFPVDYRQGDYLLAILLTTLGAVLAAIWPAMKAARIDPVKAIGS